MKVELVAIGIIAVLMVAISGVQSWANARFRKIQHDADEAWERRGT